MIEFLLNEGMIEYWDGYYGHLEAGRGEAIHSLLLLLFVLVLGI